MAKTANSLTAPLEFRVTYQDGSVHDYVTTPVDQWRAEKVSGLPFDQIVSTFTGFAALAYSCALRAGHAYRTRKSSTDESANFQEWLETKVTDVALLTDEDEEAAPKDEADSLGE